MAEALAAVGLASSIITFLNFGVELAKLTKEIHRAQGELPKDLQQCQATVDEFSEWIRNLQTSQTTSGGVQSQAEEALKKAIDRCVGACEDLQNILQSLLPPATAQSKESRAAHFKTALRTVRKDGSIKRAQNSLETQKNDLRLCIAERTMALAIENRDAGVARQRETQQMYTDLTQLQATGLQETRRIGDNLQSLHAAGKDEIITCIAQHNLQFDQIHGSIGLVKADLDTMKLQNEDTLLLVKRLASVVNQRSDGSAMICIRIPRQLYDPSLTMWNGFRAYTERAKAMVLPGGWEEDRFELSDQLVRHVGPEDRRVSYISVSDSSMAVEKLPWTRNVVSGSWSMRDFESAYDKSQSWLSYFLCYEIAAVRCVPLIRNPDVNEDDEEISPYRTWLEATTRLRLTGSDTESVDAYSGPELPNSNDVVPSEESRGSTQQDEARTSAAQETEPEMGIRRRDSIPEDVAVEESDLDKWIKELEEDVLRNKAESMSLMTALNERLLNMKAATNDQSTKEDIEKMLKHFEQRASYEMPELVQMMTTAADTDKLRESQFRWGFQLVVARNQTNFQLVVFCVAVFTIWLSNPLSSSVAQWVVGLFYSLLCAPPWRTPLPAVLLFIIRCSALLIASKLWFNHHDLVISTARYLAPRNEPWEARMLSKRKSTTRRSRRNDQFHAIFITLSLLSASKYGSVVAGAYLEKLTSFAWCGFFCIMFIRSLWLVKDWFKLHPDASLHVYTLGSFLAIVVFICAILSAV